jgi:chromosome segregation ATPase
MGFNIKAGSVQNMVTGEKVDIHSMNATQESGAADSIEKLVEALEKQAIELSQKQRCLTEVDLATLASVVSEAMKNFKDQPDDKGKKAALGATLEKIKGVLGPVSDLLSTVFKLAGLVGLA